MTREPKGKGLAEEHLRQLSEAAAAEGPNKEAIVCLLGLNRLRVSEVCAAQIEDSDANPAATRCDCAARAARNSGYR